MKKVNFSKIGNYITDHKKIMDGATSKINPNTNRTVDWKSGENFQIFTLFKSTLSGTTTTESCLTYNNSNA